MRLGVSVRSAYAVDDPRVGAQWMIERAQAARDAGLDSLFVGDHHATAPAAYYQNVPIIARILADWGEEVSGALWLLPLWHPVIVAEQIGTLASLARGRFVMQTALGGGRAQFAAMGVDIRRRAADFELGLDVVRRLLAGEVVSTGADAPWQISDAQIAPRPPEPVEVWIGGTAPPAIDRAARLGDGFLAAPELVPSEAGETCRAYLDRCRVHGRTPSVVAIRRDIHVGADDADAARVAEPVVAEGYRGFRPDACTYGGVERVAEQLRRYGDMGYTDVIVRMLAPEQPDAVASLERLGAVRDLLRT